MLEASAAGAGRDVIAFGNNLAAIGIYGNVHSDIDLLREVGEGEEGEKEEGKP